jgi:putative mRNA 3-end processing factor
MADVYIDPWLPVNKAIITHAHSDHARQGHNRYFAHHHSKDILNLRLGNIRIETVEYGKEINMNGVRISLHPAGHIIGSSQVRLEHKTDVAVITGDFKLEDDEISVPFEFLKANTLIMESTFGLPVYKWERQKKTFQDINQWWAGNRSVGITSILCGYALGKAQRLLYHINSDIGPVYVHGAVYNVNEVLNKSNPEIKLYPKVENLNNRKKYTGSLIITPSSALNTPWMNKFQPYRTAIASGWMGIRGARRRRAIDRGFVLSDHADWDQLNRAVIESEAGNIYVTHGYSYEFSKWLLENGLNAGEVKTRFEGELGEINEQASGLNAG